MVDGVSIIATDIVYKDIGVSAFEFFGCCFLTIIFLTISIALFREARKVCATSIFILLTFVSAFLIGITAKWLEEAITTPYTQYIVSIKDDTKYNEFIEKYDIISEEYDGIYRVEEKIKHETVD